MMAGTPPTVAVVVPCRNEARHVAALLDALAAQDHRPDEVVVVDDASTDETAATVRQWTERHPDRPVRVVQGPGRGPGPAMNAGIAATQAAIVMRMDGHARPAPEYLRRALTHLQPTDAARPTGVVGGVWQIEPGAPTTVARAIAAVVSHPAGAGGAQYRSPSGPPVPREVETVPFGVFRRSTWEAVGGYDPSLAVNEDFDFNYRVRRTGARIVLDPAMQSTYVARRTLAALTRQYFRYGVWKARMLRKHPSSILIRQVVPAMLLPWLLVTGALAVWGQGWLMVAGSVAYPAGVVMVAGHAAVTRRVSWWACAAALVIVHLAWSVGWWVGVWRRPGEGVPC